MDDMDWWVWLIIAVAIIALIAVVAYAMRNQAAARAAERNRHRAGELREEAQVTGVEASRREADAASARAEAEEASVAAEQLERQARGHEQDAGEVRAEAGERLAEADRIDPDANDDGLTGRGATTDDRVADGGDGMLGDRSSGEHVRDTRRDTP